MGVSVGGHAVAGREESGALKILAVSGLLTLVPALALTPGRSLAQEPDTGPTRSGAVRPNWQAGVAVPGSFMVGDASDFLSDGIGILGFFGRRATGLVWVRADVSYVWLRDESFRGEEANDGLLSLGVGPEFSLGWPVFRFYLRGAGGLVGNFQSRRGSSLPEETTWAGYLGGGLGLRVRIRGSSVPIFLDLGGDIFKTGELVLATVSDAGGSTKQALGMITLRAGLTIGFP